MATATLMLHCGARRVGRDELALVPTPEPTKTWFPVPHVSILDTTLERLREHGYRVLKTDLALNKANTQFFGTLDLDCELVPGVTLAVGLRNSTDKSFPMGFAAGNRTFVCDNLALRSELLVKRKHSRFGEERFGNAITQATASLRSFAEVETQRVQLMQQEELTEDRAMALILKAHLRHILSHRHLKGVVRQWNEPVFDWGGKTLWRMMNAMTFVLADVSRKSPHEYANRTIQANRLLSPFAGVTVDSVPVTNVPALAG